MVRWYEVEGKVLVFESSTNLRSAYYISQLTRGKTSVIQSRFQIWNRVFVSVKWENAYHQHGVDFEVSEDEFHLAIRVFYDLRSTSSIFTGSITINCVY